MGNGISIEKVNFDDMQKMISNDSVIINTLHQQQQDCLISKSVAATDEERLLNNLLKNNKNEKIVVYGKNACDDNIIKKYNQLISLGFTNVAIYPGGMFEWLLLQDCYGEQLFKTTGKELDILKYK